MQQAFIKPLLCTRHRCVTYVCVCVYVFKRERQTERERQGDGEREEVPSLKEPTSVGSKMVRRSTFCGDGFKEEGTVSREASRGGPQHLFLL